MNYLYFLLAILLTAVDCMGQDDGRTIRIPVIIHVLYADSTKDNGVSERVRINGNNTQYLPTSKLQAELRNLSEDLMLLNRDTSEVLQAHKSLIGNPNIEFFLADTILQEGGEKGIIRKKTSKNEYSLWRESSIIDSKRYLNIYIGNIRNSSGDFTSGFVNSSSNSSVCNPWKWPNSDAIYLRYKWVGLDYRLLTHEAGHWLGLWHVFKYGCIDEGDKIEDTPEQKKATDGACLKCPPRVTDKKCSTESSSASNFNNYMDYSGCRKMFTHDQASKMREVVRLYRRTIWDRSK
jgi:hypothetical protein